MPNGSFASTVNTSNTEEGVRTLQTYSEDLVDDPVAGKQFVAARRPGLALVNNAPTPYRLHLHSRIANEIPELQLSSLFTHEVSNAPWEIDLHEAIWPIYFGRGEKSGDQSRLVLQLREWRKGRKIMRWIRQHSVRAVVLAGYNDLARLHILSLCKKDGIPCFLFGDSNILLDNSRGLKSLVKYAVVRTAARLAAEVCYCGELGRQYFSKYGARAEGMFPFPYEPDYELTRNIAWADVERVRAEFHLDPQRRRFIFSGRLAPEKRVDLLIRAFASIASERSDWDLLIVGHGPLRAELSGLVPPALRNRVLWTGFVQDPALVSTLYRCSDILVLPSDYEPWGIVVAEAATCLGLVCSSIVGAAKDLLQDGVNGRIFAPGDPVALSDALRDVSLPGAADRMKAKSPEVLQSWRKRSDPVLHLRRALQRAQVLA